MSGDASGVACRTRIRDAVASPRPALVPLQDRVQPVRRFVGTATGEIHSHGLADQRIAAFERGPRFSTAPAATIDRHGICKR